MLTDCLTTSQAHFIDQVCEVVHGLYANCIPTISNDDHQKLIACPLSQSIYWYHHSDCKTEVRLNSIDSVNVLTINLDSKKDISALFPVGEIAKSFFQNSKSKITRWPCTSDFIDKMTPEYLLLASTAAEYFLDNWTGDSFLHVAFEVDTYQSMQITSLDTHI